MNTLKDAISSVASKNITTHGEAFNAILSQCELSGITNIDEILALSNAADIHDNAKLDYFDILAIGILSQQFHDESDFDNHNF